MFDVYTLFCFLVLLPFNISSMWFLGTFICFCVSYVHFIEDPQPGLRYKTHHTVKSPRLFRYNTINRMECTIKLKIPFGIPKSCWIQKIPYTEMPSQPTPSTDKNNINRETWSYIKNHSPTDQARTSSFQPQTRHAALQPQYP